MLTGFLASTFVLLTPFFFSADWLALVIFKILSDYLPLLFLHRKLGIEKNMKYFAAFELYYVLYVFAIPFALAINRKVIWKDRKY